jgi:hypothetical protein
MLNCDRIEGISRRICSPLRTRTWDRCKVRIELSRVMGSGHGFGIADRSKSEPPTPSPVVNGRVDQDQAVSRPSDVDQR